MIYHINKIIDKTHLILSIDAEKTFDKTSTYDTNSQQMGIEGTHLKIVKVIYDKATVDIILNSKELKAFL